MLCCVGFSSESPYSRLGDGEGGPSGLGLIPLQPDQGLYSAHPYLRHFQIKYSVLLLGRVLSVFGYLPVCFKGVSYRILTPGSFPTGCLRSIFPQWVHILARVHERREGPRGSQHRRPVRRQPRPVDSVRSGSVSKECVECNDNKSCFSKKKHLLLNFKEVCGQSTCNC